MRTVRAGHIFRQTHIISFILFISVAILPLPAQAFDILLGTGEPGSFSYFTGRILCRMLNSDAEGISCRQVPASDDVHNLTNLQGGSLDISLVDSQVLLSAVNKTGKFKFFDLNYADLRVLAPMYETPVTLVVRNDAGISSLSDLKGKRINAGYPQSPQHLAIETILKAKEWKRDDFSLVGALPPLKGQDTKAFCYGTVQAMVYIGLHPDFSLRRVLKTCNGSLMNMDDHDIDGLVKGDAALWKINLAAGTYPSHPEEIATFGTRVMLVASGDLDQDIVYTIIKALDKNRNRLISSHSALSLFSDDVAQKSIQGIPLHVGAAQYYEEQ